jgi:AcrR family transcriptional regulator
MSDASLRPSRPTGGRVDAPARGSRRGRRAAVTREDVLALVMDRYLRGQRVDVQAVAAELGLGRTTMYRWFGSREQLIGEVIVRAAEPVLADARRRARGEGAQALLETFDSFNRAIAASAALRRFVERERDAALRVLTSSRGYVQPRIVDLITALIAREVSAGAYEPPTEPATLAYAIVRLAEAFIYTDADAGIGGDVERLREVEAAMLGVPNTRAQESR